LPAGVWERDVLPARLVDYSQELLDQLSVSGDGVWWRPRPSNAPPAARATTVATSPIAIVARGALAQWRSGAAAEPPAGMSGAAQRVLGALETRGASFFVELVQASGLLRVQVEEALGELVARGLVTADSFNGLRALLTPQSRRRGFRGRGRLRGSMGFDSAGRWALLAPPDASAPAREDAIAHAAMALLRRYGVVTRALLGNETLAPSWRELLPVYRSAEARGEIRGGRFVEPLGGEQFALAEAVEELRRLRRNRGEDEWVEVSPADPGNLSALMTTQVRRTLPGVKRVLFKSGTAVAVQNAVGIEWLTELSTVERRHAAELLAPREATAQRYDFARRGLLRPRPR
jgi:ATP-dependent Lhr-like helicase